MPAYKEFKSADFLRIASMSNDRIDDLLISVKERSGVCLGGRADER